MANLSYCRFRNTLADLHDCYEHLFDELEDTEGEEARAREQLVLLCKEIVLDYCPDVEIMDSV